MDAEQEKKREKLLFSARICEQSERYQDMIEVMKKVVEMGQELNEDERNLLSVAYKNVVGGYRASWRVIKSIESKVIDDPDKVMFSEEYRKKVESDLNNVCQDILKLCDECFIPKASDPASKVFYLKMKGDYLRYLAEVLPIEARKDIADEALAVYSEAATICKNELCPTDSISLGLSLNFSVFHYEILNQAEEAKRLAKEAFDTAIAKYDSLREETRKDSTLILQLLRDNLTLWSNEMSQDGGVGDGDEE